MVEEKQIQLHSSTDTEDTGVRVTFLAFQAIYCSWTVETTGSPSKSERGCFCTEGWFMRALLLIVKVLSHRVREPFMTVVSWKQLKPEEVPLREGMNTSIFCVCVWSRGGRPRAALECAIFLTKALPPAPLMLLKYISLCPVKCL